MAIKTFTTGEVLTAADTNEYLANSGLVYVTSATVGSGVSTATVSNCFSSAYDSYRVVWSGGVMGAASNVGFRLGSSTNSYYGFMPYGTFSSASVSGTNDNNTANFSYAGGGDGNVALVSCDVFMPFLTIRTEFASRCRYGNVYGHYVGVHDLATSYTSLTLVPNGTTLTGGTITVYGYRKA